MEAIDWKTLGAAIGTLIVTIYISWKGFKDKQKENNSPASVVAGVIQDNTSIRENTQAVCQLVDEVRQLRRTLEETSEGLRMNNHALTRLADIELISRRR